MSLCCGDYGEVKSGKEKLCVCERRMFNHHHHQRIEKLLENGGGGRVEGDECGEWIIE